jgi:hypothetical protein
MNKLFNVFALVALFVTSAQASEAPHCHVIPSGGLPVVYVDNEWIEKKWDLAQARELVDELIADESCTIDHAKLSPCRIEKNRIFWAVYSEGFWQNFHEEDLAGAEALVADLRAKEFCY